MKVKSILITGASLLAITASASAATSFTGLDLGTAANWDNGLPSAGNDGTIAVDGTVGTVTVAGNVVHTTGDLAGPSAEAGDITLNGSGNSWAQSGGTISMGHGFKLNNLNYTLSGGAINFGNFTNGGRIIASSGASFTQTGGTINGGGYDANGTAIVLSGGNVINMGNIASGLVMEAARSASVATTRLASILSPQMPLDLCFSRAAERSASTLAGRGHGLATTSRQLIG